MHLTDNGISLEDKLNDTADDIGGVFDVATFTLSADLDAERTVTLWCDGEKLSSPATPNGSPRRGIGRSCSSSTSPT